jgi:hypothetical protein
MYTNSQNKVIIQNLDNEAFSWFTHQFSFNIALQSGWQASVMYFGPSRTGVEI